MGEGHRIQAAEGHPLSVLGSNAVASRLSAFTVTPTWATFAEPSSDLDEERLSETLAPPTLRTLPTQRRAMRAPARCCGSLGCVLRAQRRRYRFDGFPTARQGLPETVPDQGEGAEGHHQVCARSGVGTCMTATGGGTSGLP